jgi:hypothetical protein
MDVENSQVALNASALGKEYQGGNHDQSLGE